MAKKKEEVKKAKMGRPTKFKEEYKGICKMMCRLGATDKQMHEALKIDNQTLQNWKKKYPDFFESIKDGKAEQDDQVQNSLLGRALGYTTKETKVVVADGIPQEIEIDKNYPPSETACIFWLSNRRPKEWRRNPTVSVETEGNISFNFEEKAER